MTNTLYIVNNNSTKSNTASKHQITINLLAHDFDWESYSESSWAFKLVDSRTLSELQRSHGGLVDNVVDSFSGERGALHVLDGAQLLGQFCAFLRCQRLLILPCQVPEGVRIAAAVDLATDDQEQLLPAHKRS